MFTVVLETVVEIATEAAVLAVAILCSNKSCSGSCRGIQSIRNACIRSTCCGFVIVVLEIAVTISV